MKYNKKSGDKYIIKSRDDQYKTIMSTISDRKVVITSDFNAQKISHAIKC